MADRNSSPAARRSRGFWAASGPESDHPLIKQLWTFEGNHIASWFGKKNWDFVENGLMGRRHASINHLPLRADERLYHRAQGRRPDDHPGLSELGL